MTASALLPAPTPAPAADLSAPPGTLLEVLHRHARSHPDALAATLLSPGGPTALRHSDLWREASRFAHLLQHRGLAPGEVVLIILPHSPDLLAAFLGALLVGAVPSFLPPLTSKQDPVHYWRAHETLFARIGRASLLTTRAHLPVVRTHLPAVPLRLLAAEDAPPGPAPYSPVSSAPGSTVLLQHSSGTTGLKKGVALTHAAVLRQVDAYAAALALAPGDCIVSWLPLYHDMGLIACFLLPLLTRTPFVLLDPFAWVAQPALLFTAIRDYRGTLCWLPNFAFHHLCRTVPPSPDLDLSSLRAWINCSEPCRAETFALFARTFAAAGVRPEHLQVCYAMAETVFAVTQTPPGTAPRVLPPAPDGSRSAALSAGPPLPGFHLAVRDPHGALLPDGTVGEISVRGPSLFTGYYPLGEETRRKLCGGWYHTGDLGFLLDGHLYITGRLHDLIIVHGRNFYAHELEFLINQVPGVHPGRCVATGWFRPAVGSEEVVVLAEPDAAETDLPRLALAIKQALLDGAGLLVYDVQLVAPGWLLKTTSGKLSRCDNLAKYLSALPPPFHQPPAPRRSL